MTGQFFEILICSQTAVTANWGIICGFFVQKKFQGRSVAIKAGKSISNVCKRGRPTTKTSPILQDILLENIADTIYCNLRLGQQTVIVSQSAQTEPPPKVTSTETPPSRKRTTTPSTRPCNETSP